MTGALQSRGLQPLECMHDFLGGSEELRICVYQPDTVQAFLAERLEVPGYMRREGDKGLIMSYLLRLSGRPRSQITA